MRENREATMFAQAISVWLLFACVFLFFWFVCAAVAYLAQPAWVSPFYRLSWAAASATVFAGGVFALSKQFAARRR
jgi:pilus assembly protein TadC